MMIVACFVRLPVGVFFGVAQSNRISCEFLYIIYIFVFQGGRSHIVLLSKFRKLMQLTAKKRR